MKKLKYSLSALVASLALALGVAMPVGATENGPPRTPTNNSCVENSCNQDNDTKNIDKSKTITLGDCSIYGDVNQSNSQNNSGENDADGGDSGDAEKGENNTSGAGGAGGSASQNNSASNNITLTCTTNNVTNAAPQVLGAQVSAPTGGVGAGAGGAVATSVGSMVGLFGSVATLGAGFVARRKFNV